MMPIYVCSCFQGPNRWIRDSEVPAAWYTSRPATSTTSYSDPEISGKQWNYHVVQNIYVGCHLPQVTWFHKYIIYIYICIYIVIETQCIYIYSSVHIYKHITVNHLFRGSFDWLQPPGDTFVLPFSWWIILSSLAEVHNNERFHCIMWIFFNLQVVMHFSLTLFTFKKC